jgi:multidrug efflux pump subunit AcrB
MQRVIVQAEAAARMKAEDLLDLFVRNAAGQMAAAPSRPSRRRWRSPARRCRRS